MVYKNLVICGGGCKAFCTIGCIRSLEQHNLLSNIDNFIGCSSGNFPILFLILGIDIIKMFSFSLSLYNNIFENENTIINIINHCGLIQGKNIVNSIEVLIEKHTGVKNIAFKQLFLLSKKKNDLCSHQYQYSQG